MLDGLYSCSPRRRSHIVASAGAGAVIGVVVEFVAAGGVSAVGVPVAAAAALVAAAVVNMMIVSRLGRCALSCPLHAGGFGRAGSKREKIKRTEKFGKPRIGGWRFRGTLFLCWSVVGFVVGCFVFRLKGSCGMLLVGSARAWFMIPGRHRP